MIKPNYRRGYAYWWHGGFYEAYDKNTYVLECNFFRLIRTQNERRQNYHANLDGHYVRGKRRYRMIPSGWDDQRCSRYSGKSWKDFTKSRKQYMKNMRP